MERVGQGAGFVSTCTRGDESNIRLTFPTAPAQAGQSCDRLNGGWVHLDAVQQQNVLCPLNQINVYEVSYEQSGQWIESGERYMW